MSGSFERLIPYVGHAFGLSQEDLVRSYRPARESDIPDILALRRHVDGDMWWDDRAFVQWRYFSRKTEAGEAPYWIFVLNGEVVGACGLEPVTLVIDGAPVRATRALDIMVRPDLDGRGLGVFMNLVLFQHFPITLVTGSNARSHEMLTRLFHYTTDLTFWKTLIRSRALIAEKLNLGRLSAVVAWPVDLLLAITRARYRVVAPSGCSIREIESFDARVGDLSRTCELPGRVLVRRSDEYLNWRFVHNPRCRHRIFAAFRDTRLDGYVVTRFNLARPNPRREAQIVDWLAAPASDAAGSVLPALIQAGVDGLVHDGAEIVSCAAAMTDLSVPMKATGFRFRPGERLPFFLKATDAATHERLSAADDWFLTRGDFDVE